MKTFTREDAMRTWPKGHPLQWHPKIHDMHGLDGRTTESDYWQWLADKVNASTPAWTPEDGWLI